MHERQDPDRIAPRPRDVRFDWSAPGWWPARSSTRDRALADAERAGTMTICVSRPAEDRLVLDL